MESRFGTWSVIAALFLTACGAAGPPATPLASPLPPGASPTVEATLTREPSRQSLTLWVPDTFSPEIPSPAGSLLADRLDSFEETHPGVDLAVRVKDVGGPAGLLDTLAAVSVAAPAVLPDVIALDPVGLSAATVKGLIVPLSGLVVEPVSPEWYAHALGVSPSEGEFFGLPFAAEAEILSYDLTRYPRPPLSWAEILAGPAPFVFPAADPYALFTLAEYVSLGGSLTDESGRPSLDAGILTEVLSFYASSRAAGVIPLSARQFAADSDTWAAVRGERAAGGTAPLSLFLSQHDPETQAALPLPTKGGAGICFAETWSWAIVAQDTERQRLSAELITWLSEAEFLGPWTNALGMLPPNRSALGAWPGGIDRSFVSRLVSVSRPTPPEEVLVTFGPPLQAAVEAVLSGGATPDAAAQAAVQVISSP